MERRPTASETFWLSLFGSYSKERSSSVPKDSSNIPVILPARAGWECWMRA
uniref:Uncharacterized protein n=1 Tax=Arcella intermedia TaxID=1963864 RepID=A0A6B2LU88_9EUKA